MEYSDIELWTSVDPIVVIAALSFCLLLYKYLLTKNSYNAVSKILVTHCFESKLLGILHNKSLTCEEAIQELNELYEDISKTCKTFKLRKLKKFIDLEYSRVIESQRTWHYEHD